MKLFLIVAFLGAGLGVSFLTLAPLDKYDVPFAIAVAVVIGVLVYFTT